MRGFTTSDDGGNLLKELKRYTIFEGVIQLFLYAQTAHTSASNYAPIVDDTLQIVLKKNRYCFFFMRKEHILLPVIKFCPIVAKFLSIFLRLQIFRVTQFGKIGQKFTFLSIFICIFPEKMLKFVKRISKIFIKNSKNA